MTHKKFSIKTKQFLVYSHVFFLVLPFLFYLFFNGCQSFFSGCNKLQSVLIMLILSGLISVIIGMIVAPLLFLRQFRKKSVDKNNKLISKFVSKVSKNLRIKKPHVYIVNDGKPFAFSYIKSSIFISLGLIELLSRKELESVILHEIYHVKNSSSLFKFSTFFIRLSPLATFTSFIEDLNKEEKDADNFAIKFQNTSKYLNGSKLKIHKYYHFDSQLENII